MIIQKNSPDSELITAEYIKQGKVVIIPTDTIYGFSARVPDCDNAIKTIKGREENKPFIELIAKPQDYKKYTEKEIPKEILALWPASLTVIIERKKELGGGTVALRCPDDEWLRTVIKCSDCSIYSTSVNRSGSPALWTIDSIIEEFGKDVSLIVADGDRKGGVPSTIIDISDGRIRLVRAGAVNLDSSLLDR